MTTRTSQLVAELVDRVSGPAGNINKSLKGIGETGKKTLADSANPLSARGSAAVVERAKRMEQGVGALGARYQVAATATRAYSSNMAATTAAMIAQARALETTGRQYDVAARKATTYFRATSAASGAMYSLSKVPRAPLGSSPSIPPISTASPAGRGKTRASEWVSTQHAAAAAAAASAAGRGDNERLGINPRVGGALAGGGTATAAWKLMSTSADEEREMRKVAVSAGAAETEINPAIERLKGLQRKLAVPYAEIKEDFAELIVMGRTWSQALRDIEGLTVARRAYGAGFGRLQTLVGENFDMKTPEQQQRALQIIAGAGKSGRFEIGDFTRRFPKLAPMLKSAGFRSENGLLSSTAMMQILADRFGTADQAAVGMENLLGEFLSPTTKGRFSKKGLDIDKIVAAAEKDGKNGFEALLAELNERTGGDERKLGEFFRNKNSLQAASALVSNFAKIAEKIAEVERNAKTAMQDDAARFVGDSKAKMDALQNAMKDAGGILGEFLAEHLTPFMERVAQGVRALTGKAGSDKEQLDFRKRQYEQGGMVTRFFASRGISRLEKQLGIGRDFSLANMGNGLSPTGVPSSNGGAFFANPIIAKRSSDALQKGMATRGSPLMHRGGVVSPATLFPGGLSPESIANTPVTNPKVETEGADRARNVFEEITGMLDTLNGKTARPNVETSPIERALDLVRQLISSLDQVEQGAARAGRAATRVDQDVRRAVRSAYSDYGMEEAG